MMIYDRNWVCIFIEIEFVNYVFARKDEIVDDGKYFAFKDGIDDMTNYVICLIHIMPRLGHNRGSTSPFSTSIGVGLKA